MTKTGNWMFVAVCMSAAAAGAADRLHWDAGVDVRWEDNIGLGTGSQEFDDITTRFSGGLVYDVIAESGREFTIGGRAFYAHVADLSDLSHYGIELAVDYRGEFGTDLTDPWYTIGVDYTLATFDDSEPRDGQWFDYEAVIGKRFNQMVNLSGGIRYHQRLQAEADPFCPQFINNNNSSCAGGNINWNPGKVFNQERFGYFVGVVLDFGADTSGFAEISFMSGDEDATGAGFGNPTTNPDRVFPTCGAGGGPGAPNSGCNIFTNDTAFGQTAGGAWYQVWKVDVDQRILEIGVNHSFTDRLSGNVTFLYMETSDVKNHDVDMEDYENTAIMASVTVGL